MQQERRRYYRIEDTVLLQTKTVSGRELEQKLEEFRQGRQQPGTGRNFNLDLAEQMADLHAIQEKMPELGRYLINLQRQVDRLTAASFSNETTPGIQQKQVSLSAQGIAFCTDELFKPVDVVEMVLQLIPTGQEILIYGRVVLAEENEDSFEKGRYRVSLDFEHIQDSDREALVKYVHSKQLQSLSSKQYAAS